MNALQIVAVAERYAPQIEVKKLDEAALVQAALKDFRKLNPGEPVRESGVSGLVLTFIRHKLTRYDALMNATRADKANGFAMRQALRVAVLYAIEREYGHIKAIKKEIDRRLADEQSTWESMQ